MPYLDKSGLTRLWAQIISRLGGKVDKVEGKGLSTNDYTDEEAAKVATAASLNIGNGTRTGSVKTSMATAASANYSFAEGQSTTASGLASHAEGGNTTASGAYSHAEGRNTTASGTASHAEGYYTAASRTASHAEGHSTTASGNYSHAEGFDTTASGDFSHVGGQNTIVKGAGGTAIGKYNLDPDSGENTLVSQLNILRSFYSSSYATTYTQPTISIENGTVTSSNTSYLTPDKFQVGMYVINDTIDEPGYFKILSTPVSGGSYYYANVDSYLITLARTTLGTYAFSVGNGTSNSNRSNAHTLDWNGNAWYAGDIRIGGTSYDDATSISDLSNLNIENGAANGSIVANHYERAEDEDYLEGENSFAEGMYTEATGTASHAEGINTIAGGTASHAEGSYTIASGYSSHAEGSNTTASGSSSHAEGDETIASDATSHAEGSGSISFNGGHAEGRTTMAKGLVSHAEGYGDRWPITLTGEASATTYTYNGGFYSPMPVGSFVFLANNIEKLVQVTASTETTITVSETLSEESLNEEDAFNIQGAAIGDFSHIEGHGTSAGGEAQHVQGKFNIHDNENKYAHIVGNGNALIRKNAHTLDWNGNAWFKGSVLIGGTGQDDANAKQLATQEYVNENVPKFTYSTVDLEAGVSPLAEGEVYFVYE